MASRHPRPYTVLQQLHSNQSDEYYEIRQDSLGKVSCYNVTADDYCKGWLFSRTKDGAEKTCRHMELWRAETGRSPIAVHTAAVARAIGSRATMRPSAVVSPPVVSTVPLSTADRLRALLDDLGLRYVDPPTLRRLDQQLRMIYAAPPVVVTSTAPMHIPAGARLISFD